MPGLRRIFALIYSFLLVASLSACELNNAPSTATPGTTQIGGGNGDGYSGNRGSPAEIVDGSLWQWTYAPTTEAAKHTDVTAVHLFNLPDDNGVKKIRVVIDRGNATQTLEMTLVTVTPEIWHDGNNNAIQLSDANDSFEGPMITLYVNGSTIVIALDQPDIVAQR